jgi:hypothetical protein
MSTPQGQGTLQQGLSGVPSAGQMNQQFFQQNGENAQLSNAIPLGAMPHWMSNGQWNDQQGVQKAGAFSPNPLLMGGGGSQAPSQPNPFGGALGGYAFGGVDTTNTPFKTLGGMPSGKQTFGPWSGAGMLQLGQGFPSSFNSFR